MFAIGMFTYVAHFDRKVGIYIATKLFQVASRKAGAVDDPRRLFPALLAPSRTAFIFAIQARAGPYGSYDEYRYLCVSMKVNAGQVQG